MTKVNKKAKAVRDKTGWQTQIQWCKLQVVTSKHEDMNLVFTNHRKEDGIYPPRKEKGSTKHTLFEIVVFKLNIFCFHV